ncbi:MAG TPA: hypothetical protein VFV32_06965 [Acidimicrobiales bacterium]|nr:hypothetical protein [Acidimicrobiales bacterium]
MSRRTIPLPFAVDLRRSLRPLRLGKHDPTIDLRVGVASLAMNTPAGPAALRAQHQGDRLEVEAWGEGAEWALEGAPGLLGCEDDRAGFEPVHPLVRQLHREADGLRLPRTHRVLDALVPAVLSQRVTGFEAKRAFRLLVERWGEPAPGPTGLRLVPAPGVIAEIGYYDLHVIGVEKKRADALQRVCAHATRLEHVAAVAPDELRTRLEAISGVGRWTSAEVARAVLGDADAVSVGDFHLKHLVSWALASEPRGTDERMLELLEPYRGHRGRVCTLLESAGISAPKYGPRQRIQPMRER